MKKIYIILIVIALIIANLPYLIKGFENLQATKDYNQGEYKKAFQLFPNDNIGFYNKANSLYKLGKYKQAIKYYSGVSFNDEKQYYILHNLGNSYFKLGEQMEKTNQTYTIQNRLASINFYKKALQIGEKFKIDKKELKETKSNLDYVLNKLKQLKQKQKQKNKENQQNNSQQKKSQGQNSQNYQNKENNKSQQNKTQNTNNKKSTTNKKNSSTNKNGNQQKQYQTNNKNNNQSNNNQKNSLKEKQNLSQQKQFEQQIQQYIQQLNQQQKYYMKYYNKKYQPKNDNPFNIQIIDPITGQPIFDNEIDKTEKDW